MRTAVVAISECEHDMTSVVSVVTVSLTCC